MAKFIKLTSAYRSDDRVFYFNADRINVIRYSKINHTSYTNAKARIELIGDDGEGSQTYHVQECVADILLLINGY